MTTARTVRVVVVDDSALMRGLLTELLSADPAIEVVGTAYDGDRALAQVAALRPDVVTVDLAMPGMDCLALIRRLIRVHRVPVVIVASLSARGAETALRALKAGAIDVVAKPEGAVSRQLGEVAEELTEKVRAAAALPPHHWFFAQAAAASSSRQEPARRRAAPTPRGTRAAVGLRRPAADQVVAIGVSTGGPYALAELLPRLPPDFPAAVVIVQHMPAGFTGPFARHLASVSAIPVAEAADGAALAPGAALLAPGDRHLRLRPAGRQIVASLSDGPPVSGHRPSADVLFASAAEAFGSRATGLIMTGMGSDGAEGLLRIRQAGGRTLAQSETSCVVSGMPKAAIARGAVDRVAHLSQLAETLVEVAVAQAARAGDGGEPR